MHSGPLGILCMQAMEEQIQTRTLAFYDQLVADMTVANLLEVPPGAPYLHMSSAVLLRGSLRVAGQAFDGSAAPAASGGNHNSHSALGHTCMLPFSS